MRIAKFYMVTTLAVISSLLYIHQHIEIVKLNYILQDNEIEVAQLLDQNKALMYNIEKLENPYLLEEKLCSDKKTFAMPDEWRIVRLGEPGKREIATVSSASEKRGIFDFLVPKALAQGKPTQIREANLILRPPKADEGP